MRPIVVLENLDRVNWKKASHAYGSAADVPALLRGLASSDASVRRDALFRLQTNIFHQGGRWEAAALAVPFLYELALDPATPDRDDLVFFLVSLAFGYESEFLPFGATLEEPECWGTYERAAYDAVAERVASLVPLLREEEPLRLAAAYALAHFPKLTRDALGDVRRAYDASTGETARATLLIALAMLSLHATDKDEMISLFRRVHGSDDSRIIRASAAAGLVLLGATDDEVVQTISAMVIEGSAETTNIPWNDGDLDGYLALVLPLAARGREEAVATALIDGLGTAQRQPKFEITRSLLGVVVPSGGYRALSDLQRRALHAIGEHGQWDRNGEAMVNFALMSNEYGLPSELEDFRSFVQAAEASARGETVDWKPRERPRVREGVDPEVPAYFAILFAVPLLLWLLVVLNHPDTLPSTPGGWGLVSFLVLGVGVSFYVAWRLSAARRKA